MPSDELHDRVKALLAREWNILPSAIPDNATINEFPQWDSLGHITIMLALENEFGLEISAETVQELLSLPKIVEHLSAHEAKGGN